MKTKINAPDPRGHHAHDVDLEDTFDFLNTDDLENGSRVDRLPTLGDALSWFVESYGSLASWKAKDGSDPPPPPVCWT